MPYRVGLYLGLLFTLSLTTCDRRTPPTPAATPVPSTQTATSAPAPRTGTTAISVQASTRPAAWAVPIVETLGLPNLYQVTATLYRGAQPAPQGFAELKKMGIKTVVNLRAHHTDANACAAAGLDYVAIPCDTWAVNPGQIREFLKVAGDPARQPVFIHCQHGADRTGTMIALYRIVAQNWTKEQAIEEMTSGGYGFHPLWQNLIDLIRQMDVQALRQTGDMTPSPATR